LHLLAPGVVTFLEGIPDATGDIDEIVILKRPGTDSFKFFLKLYQLSLFHSNLFFCQCCHITNTYCLLKNAQIYKNYYSGLEKTLGGFGLRNTFERDVQVKSAARDFIEVIFVDYLILIEFFVCHSCRDAYVFTNIKKSFHYICLMNRKKFISIVFAVLLFSIPVMAVFDGNDLGLTLHNLRLQLEQEYGKISRRQARMAGEVNQQHQKMVDLIKECNELSLVLYSQRQEFTFDLAYALKKVTDQYNEFNNNRRPYDRIAASMDMEIDRYARMLESLRRLPPERSIIELDEVPDSLMYHNDSLDMHVLMAGTSMNRELSQRELTDTTERPFILDERGEADRDSCIFYASELLKMCADSKAAMVADSTHYLEAHIRLKESYDYARSRYQILQKRIFVEGQTPWIKILGQHSRYWTRCKEDLRDKYDFNELDDGTYIVSSKTDYTTQILFLVLMVVLFLIVFGIVLLIVFLLHRFVKPLKKVMARQQRFFVALLIATLIFVLRSTGENNSIMDVAFDQFVTFLWLQGAIVAAMLIRLKPEQLRIGLRLYAPTVLLAFAVISCRVLFLPNSLMNYLFPPVLLVFCLWQLAACLRCGNRADSSDRVISWISLAVTAVATVMSILGFIFMALLVLVWWYFQLAVIHTIATIARLLDRYRTNRMARKIKEFKEKNPSGIAQHEKIFLFKVTWFHDLISTVIIPLLALGSIPVCLRLALNVFDFDDLYQTLYYSPFVSITDAAGSASLQLTFHNLLVSVGLFFVFRYLGEALRAIFVDLRYKWFMHKNNRRTVRNNEINFALSNSIITIFNWAVYIMIIFLMLKIPTGWIVMIATGLSAGIGIALKDIINNFIYGIQLMGGRLRVGDWIECDGVRGTVTKISYQTTQIETVDDAIISFPNADLFSKNYANLTRNNSYELLKIIVGVAYGTDVQKVRDVLVEAMQVMRTKDKYGREIVRPDKGIYVVMNEFGSSSVDIAVKQYILAAERIGYVDRAKEVIYNALNSNGITIPFPQVDVHFDKED